MPRHKQVTECRRGGPVSKLCACEHCTLAVCSTCGSYEGSLTTDCPGGKVSFDRQQEIYETNLDYTDDRGWHQGASMKQRVPRFDPEPVKHAAQLGKPGHAYAITGCSCGWRLPYTADPDTAFADHVATAQAAGEEVVPNRALDLVQLRRDLEQKAIAWARADRACEDCSAALTRAQDAIASNAHDMELHRQLEQVKIDFHITDDRAQQCDDAFRQAARKLATLEETPR